jgi:copper chaperone CopZ
MKRLFSFLFCFMLISIAVSAQTKAIQTVKLNTPTVQCGMCKTKIESAMKRYDGIMTVNVNYKKKETTVKYITDRINEETIKTAIANIGYDANEVSATPDAYKMLPKCCKKPADGGGMKSN